MSFEDSSRGENIISASRNNMAKPSKSTVPLEERFLLAVNYLHRFLSAVPSRLWEKGGGAVSKKKFSTLRASFWSKNKGGWAPLPLPWIRHWFVCLSPASLKRRHRRSQLKNCAFIQITRSLIKNYIGLGNSRSQKP